MKKSKIDRVISVVVIGICLIKAVLYGGSKPPSSTNEPPEIVDGDAPTNAAPPVLMASRPRLVMSPSASYPSQSSYSSQSITNWTARGAYCDWRPITFSGGFRFPVGTNVIEAVTLFAWGEVRVKSKSRVEVEEWWLDSCSGWSEESDDKFRCSTSTPDFDSSRANGSPQSTPMQSIVSSGARSPSASASLPNATCTLFEGVANAASVR